TTHLSHEYDEIGPDPVTSGTVVYTPETRYATRPDGTSVATKGAPVYSTVRQSPSQVGYVNIEPGPTYQSIGAQPTYQSMGS